MEQREASFTQIHLTMLAHYLGLSYVLETAYTSYDTKSIFKHILSETTEIAPATVCCLCLFMNIMWTV
jgi:hypothetical protein